MTFSTSSSYLAKLIVFPLDAQYHTFVRPFRCPFSRLSPPTFSAEGSLPPLSSSPLSVYLEFEVSPLLSSRYNFFPSRAFCSFLRRFREKILLVCTLPRLGFLLCPLSFFLVVFFSSDKRGFCRVSTIFPFFPIPSVNP